MSNESIRYLLKKHHIKPDAEKGQHFLFDDAILRTIVECASVQPSDTVIEVGAGIGNLTALLAQKAGHVIAVEIDRRYGAFLGPLAAVNENVSVLYEDFLNIPFERLGGESHAVSKGDYIFVANIPYYITAQLIRTILHYPVLPKKIVMSVQKEVAERICAEPGRHSKLSLSVQFYAQPAIVRTIPRAYFYPAPEIDSALLTISAIRSWRFAESEKHVWQLISIGFSSKRKKLANNLSAGLQKSREDILAYLREAHIGQNARAQDLSLEQWIALARGIR